MFDIFKKEKPITEAALRYQEYIRKEREEDKKWANEPSLIKTYVKNGVAVTIYYERKVTGTYVRVDNGLESYDMIALYDRELKDYSISKDQIIEDVANYMIDDLCKKIKEN